MGLEGKVAVVSGAGQGIGRAISRRLSEAGVRVAAVDLRESEETLSLLANPDEAVSLVCDVTSPEQVEQLRAQVEDRLGTCQILVNNVGTYPPKPFAEVSFEDWRRVQTINVDSMFLMAKAFAPTMAERGWGRIVNLGSAITSSGIRDLLPYMASKGAVHALTRALANEFAERGVTVNAVAPSIVPTDGVFARDRGPVGLSHEEELRVVMSHQAIPRNQKPEDVAGAVAFLASDEAEFITAQILHVDGGLVRSGA